MKLTLESETIGRTGGITGSGAKKILGAPHIDSLEVVLRESVQNSWDAAENEVDGITFGVEAFEFTGRTRTNLLDALEKGTGGRDPVLRWPDGPLDALVLWDRGTSGLGGSVRADAVDGGKRDFVRFVYMIGDTKAQTDAFAKGGTYGFGRSSFLNASAVGTILVSTVCEHKNRLEPRFIGMSWTDPDAHAQKRYTGRHWWGEKDGAHVLPLTGVQARRQAEAIGLPPFGEGELGTAICILNPRWPAVPTGDAAAARKLALQRVQAGLLWNCWPRIHSGSIKVSITWFGRKVPLPQLGEVPRLNTFVKAYEAAQREHAKPGTWVRNVELLRPQRALGTVGLAMSPFISESRASDPERDEPLDVQNPTRPLHHVAMMRGTRLVIHYFEGPEPPDGLQYGGVFIADEEVDAVLAASEPPAHDEWVKERLSGTDRRVVSVTYKRTIEVIRESLQLDSRLPHAEGSNEDLAALSDALGDLLIGATGDGIDHGGPALKNGERPSLGPRRLAVTTLTPQRRAVEGGLELRVPVVVNTGRKEVVRVRLHAQALVSIDGGVEKVAPQQAALPRVIGWQAVSGAEVVPAAEFNTYVTERSTCTLLVYQPQDCTLRLVIDAK